MSAVANLTHDDSKTLGEIVYHLKGTLGDELNRLFSPKNDKDLEGKIHSRLKEAGKWMGIIYDEKSQKFKYDGTTLNKPDTLESGYADLNKADYEKGEYEIWRRNDEDLNLLIELEDRSLIWRIQQNSIDDIFSLFGKADKFPAQVDKILDRGKLLDSGTIKLGAQRDGYHEYFLSGDMHKGKMHFRIVPVENENKWLTWTGYEQTPADSDSDKGVWDIDIDRYKGIKYTE